MSGRPVLTLDPCSADRPAGAQGHPGSLMALARRASAHRGSAAVMIPSLHKEWLHFCVIDGDVEALVNLSVMPRRQAAIGRPQLEGRVVLMVRMAGQWWGGVDHFDASAVAARPGQPGLAVGGSHVRFETDCIRVQAGLESGDVSVDLTLVPLTVPVLRRPFVRGAVGWGVVPRLMATGEVRTRNTTRTIAGPWAYHDHNWGVFRWGDEFLWQWGMALPTGPGPAWTTVFTRLLDNGRLTESGRALLLWRDQDLVRVFRDLSVSYVSHDLRRCRSIPKFPPIMRLLAPELDTDIPARLSITARDGQDWVRAELVVQDAAQLLVPSDRGLGVLAINECTARLEGEGRIAGEAVVLRGRGIFEHLTAQGEGQPESWR